MNSLNKKDQNKFILVAYEKDNILNRKCLKFTTKINGKEKVLDKYSLSMIDKYTSSYSHLEFYKRLLSKNSIKKEQTEFVIWYKYKDVIKQLPVIFNDKNIKLYSEYVIGLNCKDNNYNDDIHIKKYDELNLNIWKDFIYSVDMDSYKYDMLNSFEQENFMNLDTFVTRFLKLPFALYEEKAKVENRILGTYNIKYDKRIKSNGSLRKNEYDIKNDMLDSYRSFRDKYIFLQDTSIDYKNMYRDLTLEDLEKKEVIYTLNDYFNLLNSSLTRRSFNDFVYNSSLVTKTVKNYTNRLANSFFDSESEDDYSRSVIEKFNRTHPNIINKLINEYYDNQNQKVLK